MGSRACIVFKDNICGISPVVYVENDGSPEFVYQGLEALSDEDMLNSPFEAAQNFAELFEKFSFQHHDRTSIAYEKPFETSRTAAGSIIRVWDCFSSQEAEKLTIKSGAGCGLYQITLNQALPYKMERYCQDLVSRNFNWITPEDVIAEIESCNTNSSVAHILAQTTKETMRYLKLIEYPDSDPIQLLYLPDTIKTLNTALTGLGYNGEERKQTAEEVVKHPAVYESLNSGVIYSKGDLITALNSMQKSVQTNKKRI